MADETTEQPQTVDRTPISPSKERKDSLEAHLKHRPDRHELVDSTSAHFFPFPCSRPPGINLPAYP